MGLLAKSSDILRATKKRRQWRRALAKVGAHETRKKRPSSIEGETRYPTPMAQTDKFVFFMVRGLAGTWSWRRGWVSLLSMCVNM